MKPAVPPTALLARPWAEVCRLGLRPRASGGKPTCGSAEARPQGWLLAAGMLVCCACAAAGAFDSTPAAAETLSSTDQSAPRWAAPQAGGPPSAGAHRAPRDPQRPGPGDEDLRLPARRVLAREWPGSPNQGLSMCAAPHDHPPHTHTWLGMQTHTHVHTPSPPARPPPTPHPTTTPPPPPSAGCVQPQGLFRDQLGPGRPGCAHGSGEPTEAGTRGVCWWRRTDGSCCPATWPPAVAWHPTCWVSLLPPCWITLLHRLAPADRPHDWLTRWSAAAPRHPTCWLTRGPAFLTGLPADGPHDGAQGLLPAPRHHARRRPRPRDRRRRLGWVPRVAPSVAVRADGCCCC